MYTCGLTVYARGHIGNFRTFVVCDVLRRALKYEAGFGMRHVMNFTDVDDRTIVESQKASAPLRDYTYRFIEAYREDAAALGMEQPEEMPRTTDDEYTAAMGQTIAAPSRATDTPTRASCRCTSGSARSLSTASWRGWIAAARRRGRV